MPVYPLFAVPNAPGLRRLVTRVPVAILVTIWSLVLAAGVVWIWNYEGSPGSSTAPPLRWPSGSMIPLHDQLPTMLLFLHPQCPCSGATVEQLARILAQHAERVDVHVIFARPVDAEQGWEQTELWHAAARIPHITLWVDDGLLETQRFTVANSGHVLLYGPSGELSFSGGITCARGHEGDSPGRSAIEALLMGQVAEIAQADVYGCPLFTEASEGP